MQPLSQLFPPLFAQAVRGVAHLEVVYIDDQEQIQFRAMIARRPVLANWLKTLGAKVLITMLCPKGATVRVPVKGLVETTSGAPEVLSFS